MASLKKVLFVLTFVCVFPFGLSAIIHQGAQIDFYKSQYLLNKDYTYTSTLEQKATVLTPVGISDLQKTSQEFFPNSQKMEVVEAYVIHSDGTKIPVTQENIFTRPSAASQDAPGFTSSLTTTVVFPQLRVGSQTYIKWQLTQTKPCVLGFSQTITPPFKTGIKTLHVTFILPKDIKLDWKERGGFIVQDKIDEDTRTVQAEIKNVPPQNPEPLMANLLDFAPVFVVSGIPSWEELGARVFKESTNTEDITSQIKELSNQIVQKKKGRDAAEAIYNWVAENIQYVAVYLNAQQGFIAHSAAEILKNGYGDCKDHVALMRALLKAQNIESYPVLVNWGNQYVPLPLPDGDQFNHEMIYLPAFGIFANPTDKFASFGVLGQGLDGKFVLIASPKGQTAYLPSSDPRKNVYRNENIISILEDGTVEGKNTLIGTGYMEDSLRSIFSTAVPQELAEEVLNQTDNGGYGNFTLSSSPFDLSKPFSVAGTWISPQAFSSGNTIYFWVPTGLDPAGPHSLRQLITPHTRLFPFVTSPAKHITKYEIKIPKGYEITHLPANTSITTPIGSYKSSYLKKGGAVLVERAITIDKSYLSAQEYESLRKVLYKLESDGHAILVMRKK